MHKINGFEDPRNDSSLLKLVLDGCRRFDRDHGYEKRLRLGISGSMLKTVVKSLNLSSLRAARWAAWACNSYFGGFRANELVTTGTTGTRCLWGHFDLLESIPSKFMNLKQYFSKARQFGPFLNIPIPRTNESTCPVSRLKHYRSFFAGRLNMDQLPAFMDLDGKPYTYRQALSDTRFYLRMCGFPGSSYGTHSFRIGMASEAGRLSLPSWVIQLLGRWNSQCFKIYIQTEPLVLAEFAKELRGTGD